MAYIKDQGEGGWIGVDFDGTLVEYHGWDTWNSFGKPIPRMLARVQQWLRDGQRVKIMTARVAPRNGDGSAEICVKTGAKFTNDDMTRAIQEWCIEHVGVALEVTCVKDTMMIELWDDRAVQVIPNTGMTLAEEREAVAMADAGKAFGDDN
ncbi:MAG: hypothetical protein JWN75_1228 [Candidatus Saccharibacteria bacterium]|nr:hypothetical protein [Candidatus Saccharibacteria bacterium]MDB5716425.1 hypothetical protein [Sphingomonadales bacterium]